ncbi:mannose-1-phosphate guanylyltransferase [Candidatus Peregrinibacteria bacterium]|nr:mannose-1-phosphate guanylyltransferase [Candidatus Peregrinibacteria bacterium]
MKAVILAGGTGTRLWPLSRDLKPKQFHTFTGNKTMLQQTYERLCFLNPRDIFVATNAQYADIVKRQLKKLPAENLIIEPAMRDTGPAICFAAARLKNLGFRHEVMAIVYADHLIQKSEEFKITLLVAAAHIKKSNKLGVIAIRAKSPNPHLGYIKIGKLINGLSDKKLEIYELEKFVEKPSIKTAKKFMLSYKYFWNTGLYMWKVGTILEKFKTHAPVIFKTAQNEKTYAQSPKISIDYAIMEKIAPKNVHVMPADLGWNDIGNWAALYEELTKKENDNLSVGRHLSIETKGSVVIGGYGKLIVTHGVKNLIIVDTPEALLVMPKEKAQDVKKIIEELKKQKKGKYL